MNILHIIDSNGIYGAETILLYLMEEQKKMGLNPVLLSLRGKDNCPREIENQAHRMSFSVFSIIVKGKLDLSAARQIGQLSSRLSAKIIHSHGYKGDVLISLFLRKMPNQAFVSTVHGYTTTHPFSKLFLYEIIDRLALNRFDAVVEVRPGLINSRHFKWLGPIGNRRVVTNGIKQLSFDNILTSNLPTQLSQFCNRSWTLGGIGRLSAEKGWVFLIQALSLLQKKGLGIQAAIVGDGPDLDQLNALVQRLNLSTSIRFFGYLNDAYRCFPLFDCFVMPSLTEGLPVTLLEAMQARVPIIATRVGAVPQLLGPSGYGILVDPGKPEALAAAIEFASNNTSIVQKMAQRACHAAQTQYSSRRMASDYHLIYRESLNKTTQ